MTNRAADRAARHLPYGIDLSGLDASPFEAKALADALAEVDADEAGDG